MTEQRSTKDQQFLNDITPHLKESEAIEWIGKPRPGFSITFLEVGFGNNAISDTETTPSFFFAFAVIIAIFSWIEGFLLIFITAIAFIFIFFVFPDIIKYQRKKYTRYAFSEDHLFFQLWWWGKKTLHLLPLSDIQQLSTEEYKNGKGIIHFISNKNLDFHTRDFALGSKRAHPTFENIPNVMEVAHKIERYRKRLPALETMGYIPKLREKIGHDKFIHPGARIIIENEKGEILFIERMDNGNLGLPAGGMEENETIEECIRREVLEETGLTLLNLTVIGISTKPERETVYYPNQDVVQYFNIEFYSNQYEGEIIVKDTKEVKKAMFLPFEKYQELPANEKNTFKALAHYKKHQSVHLN